LENTSITAPALGEYINILAPKIGAFHISHRKQKGDFIANSCKNVN
jgi:hypothetical protein